MNWFNYYGLIIMVLIMVPNIVYAIKHKNDNCESYNNKLTILFEQIGRYGCFVFMILNILKHILIFGLTRHLWFICQ